MLQVGLILNISPDRHQTDKEVLTEYIRVAEMVEPLGFDSIFVLEHHFTDYVLSPSPLQLLTYLAGRTSRIKLGTSVIVLPWNNPIQIAEQISVLSILSNGRGIFGFGRGKSQKEFAGFGVPMKESRERFLESIQIIKGLLIHDEFSFKGNFFDIPLIGLRPKSTDKNNLQFYGVSSNKAILEENYSNGLGLITTCKDDWNETKELIQHSRNLTGETVHENKPPIVLVMLLVKESRTEALSQAAKYLENDFRLVDDHYGYSQNKLSKVPGYQSYKETEVMFEKMIKTKNVQGWIQNSISLQIIGDPADCIQKMHYLYWTVGIRHFVIEFSFGGMPVSELVENLKLFSKRVLPEIKIMCT